MSKMKPLVLDVDGTYLRTDLLYECFWSALGTAPLALARAIFRNIGSRAALKRALAELAPLRTDLLPVHPELGRIVDDSRKSGREMVLASASDEHLVARLAADHGLSKRVFASDGATNLKGRAKAEALVAAYGDGGFDYAGNERADRAIWDHAENAIIIGHFPSEERALTAAGKSVTTLDGGWRVTSLLRAMRPHQWVKNVLLLLPLISAHRLDMVAVLPVLLGIVAFSAAASCIYIVNDLLDLEADRQHPTKRNRPFASGAVPIPVGMLACIVLGAVALGIAASINMTFFGVVVLYMLASLAYSLHLKRMRWIDIAMLASLYTLRVIAGAMAATVDVTGYLLVFIFPVFLTLGCVKRLTELTLATDDARLPGRGYGRPDRPDLLNVAGLGTFSALLIFFLYSFTDQALILYQMQWPLWLALLPIAAWLIRMVTLGWQGKQDYDPIIFALRDKIGLALIAIIILLLFFAAGMLPF